MDRVLHGTDKRGLRHHNVKLTPEAAREIKQSTERGCALAHKFGVSQATICDIRKGRNWAWL